MVEPGAPNSRAVRVRSAAETRRLAARLGKRCAPGDVIGLVGGLGAGKTCFVQGLAAGLGVPKEERVASPTFNIVLEHPGRLRLVHVDLYRIGSTDELAELGLAELLHGDAVSAVEWIDRFPALAPRDYLEIKISGEGPKERTITAVPHGPRAAALLLGWIK